MTSPLSLFTAELVTRLQALTPDVDVSGLSFHELTGPGNAGGADASSHRGFLFLPPKQFKPEQQAGEVLQAFWFQDVKYFCHRFGRDPRTWGAAIADELERITRAWSNNGSPWGAGVDEVLLEVLPPTTKGDVYEVSFQFRVFVQRGVT